jgi:ERF superfamily protein
MAIAKDKPKVLKSPASKQPGFVRDLPVPIVQSPREVRMAEPATLYSAIIQAARDPAVDADKMKTLVELQIRVEKWEAEKAFTRAFNALQFELPTIDKDGKIDHGDGTTARGNKKLKTTYSTYPNLMRICRPLLRKHGFTFNNVIEPSADQTKIVIVGYLTHVDGHSMKSDFPLGADAGPGRSNAQAWGSSSSYGKRYNLILLLDIVSEAPSDQDNDGYPRRGEPVEVAVITDAQVAEVLAAINESGVGAIRFCEKFKINAVPELPANRFNDALKACKNYAQEVANRRAKTQTSDDSPGDH